MKREILFKGFHTCENGTQIAVVNGKEYRGEWVEGNIIKIYSEYLQREMMAIVKQGAREDMYEGLSYEEVDPETVGEYIKSLPYGDKVFSNSRLEIISTVKGEGGWSVKRIDTAILRFNEKHCEWELKVTHNGAYKRIARAGYFLNNSDTKVIGTIFDKEAENG